MRPAAPDLPRRAAGPMGHPRLRSREVRLGMSPIPVEGASTGGWRPEHDDRDPAATIRSKANPASPMVGIRPPGVRVVRRRPAVAQARAVLPLARVRIPV